MRQFVAQRYELCLAWLGLAISGVESLGGQNLTEEIVMDLCCVARERSAEGLMKKVDKYSPIVE